MRMKRWIFTAVFLIFAAYSVLGFGNEILGLYKSTENQTDTENEILFYLSIPLKEMGLTVRYWDIDRGIPDTATMNRVRAVVSWFRGPAMGEPEKYLEFLKETMDSGGKVIIIDNLGAYQDRDTGQYLDSRYINAALGKLGIRYMGDWTDKPEKLRIVDLDRSMTEWQLPQDLKKSGFYYRFQKVDKNLRSYLSLERTDQNHPASPVIVTNRRGGFALSQYIYRIEDGRVKMMLNLPMFLQEALFPGPTDVRIALLSDRGNEKIRSALTYTEGVLKRAKIPHDTIPPDRFNLLLAGDLRKYASVGLILKDDAGLDPRVMDEYLAQGGGIVSLYGGNFDRLAPVLEMSERVDKLRHPKGYRFRYGFVLGEGVPLEEREQEWTSGFWKPSDRAEILATSFDGITPLAWVSEKGDGQVLTWNWNAFGKGEFQGLILESFLRVVPVGVAATAGLGIMFIDDWPLPMYNIVKPPYEVTDTEFYTEIWWPEIKEFFESYDIPFSSFIIFNYNATVSPPFTGGEFYAAEDMASLAMAYDILDTGRELDLHGYNHLSMTLEETEVNLHPWPSLEAMEEALREAKAEWVSLFGEHELPFAYVAPNNIISRDGETALTNVFTSIRVISALRMGEGDITVTEIGAHPAIPSVYYIPRNSWGYPFSSYMRQLVISAITGAGVWSHFIHADDVYDPARSGGLDWEGLKAEFHKMIRFVKQHYPWIEFVSLRDAYYRLRRMDEAGVTIRKEGDDIVIESLPGTLFRVRINEGSLDGLTGGEIRYSYNRMPALIIETTGSVTRLDLKP